MNKIHAIQESAVYFEKFFTACTLFKLALLKNDADMKIAALRYEINFDLHFDLLDYAQECFNQLRFDNQRSVAEFEHAVSVLTSDMIDYMLNISYENMSDFF